MTLGRLGAWCSIASSYVVEVLGSCGFDWICIDLQHGFAGLESLLPMVQAAAITQTPALVRVPRLDAGMIGRALDAGAAGVIVPMVNSAAEARAAVAACRYPPDGVRSWGPARLMLADPEYSAQRANAQVHCLVMVETLDAVRNLSEIAPVAGVTAVFVGPSDLAVDMGLHPAPRRDSRPARRRPGEYRPGLPGARRARRDLRRYLPGRHPVRGDGLQHPRRSHRRRAHPGGATRCWTACAPQPNRIARSRHRRRKRGTVNIDIHNHAIPQRVFDLVERKPEYGVSLASGTWHGPNIGDFALVEAWASPDGKLRELDRKGLDAPSCPSPRSRCTSSSCRWRRSRPWPGRPTWAWPSTAPSIPTG